MKRLAIEALAVAAVVVLVNLLAGCSTLGNGKLDLDAGAAIEAAAAGASGDYAAALKKIAKVVAKPGSVDPLEGYSFTRTYFVEGMAVPASQITWKDEWSRTGSAGKESVPLAPAAPGEGDEALAGEIADILTEMGLAK